MKISFDLKLKTYWGFLHICAFILLFMHFDFFGLCLSYLIYLLIKGIGSEIGAHRYFTHKSFTTSIIKQKFLIILQTFAGEGSILTFVGLHRLHHHYADTNKDPHSSLYKKWYEVFYFINPPNIPLYMVRDCMKNNAIKLQHQYYFHFHILLLFLLLISPYYYLYLIVIPILLSIYTNAIINYFLHSKIDNQSGSFAKNNKTLNIFLYGAGYHANHHEMPSSYKFAEGWQDPIGKVISKFFTI